MECHEKIKNDLVGKVAECCDVIKQIQEMEEDVLGKHAEASSAYFETEEGRRELEYYKEMERQAEAYLEVEGEQMSKHYESLTEEEKLKEEKKEDDEYRKLVQSRRKDIFLADNEDYSRLHEQLDKIENEIQGLMLESNYSPLTCLASDIENVLKKGMLEGDRMLAVHLTPSSLSKERQDAVVRDFLAQRIKWTMDNMTNRKLMLEPLMLRGHLDRATVHRYKQVIECFVNGQKEACCALARSVAEALAKRLIIEKGYGDLLSNGRDRASKMSIRRILGEKLNFKEDALNAYSNVAERADHVLHAGRITSEENCLESIRNLQKFIVDSEPCH